MKVSRYNRWIPIGNSGKWVVYNTISGGIALVNEDTKNEIDRNNMQLSIKNDSMETLITAGVLVDDDLDELSKFKVIYEKKKYDGGKMDFLIVPTYSCNLSCPYCWQIVQKEEGLRSSGTYTMKGEIVNATIDFVKKTVSEYRCKNLRLSFFGGEPFLTSKLCLRILNEIDCWVKDKDIKYTVDSFTNATLLTTDVIERFLEYPLNKIRTTVDGPKERHDKYRHYKSGKGTYEDIMKAISLLIDHGIHVIVTINLDKTYRAWISELLDDLKTRGLMDVELNPAPLVDVTRSAKDFSSMSKESTFAMPITEADCAELYTWYLAFRHGFKLPKPSLGECIPCPGVRRHTYLIDPFGDIYGCDAPAGLKNVRIGYLDKNGDMVRTSNYYRWMSRDPPSDSDECRDCSFLPACGGSCLWMWNNCAVTTGAPPPIRYLCGLSTFLGDEYVKMYLKQEYPEKFKELEIDIEESRSV